MRKKEEEEEDGECCSEKSPPLIGTHPFCVVGVVSSRRSEKNKTNQCLLLFISHLPSFSFCVFDLLFVEQQLQVAQN